MNYEGIIHLPHPEPQRHPRMAPLDRAAQFSAFAALTGFDRVLDGAEQTHLSDYTPDTDPESDETDFPF